MKVVIFILYIGHIDLRHTSLHKGRLWGNW